MIEKSYGDASSRPKAHFFALDTTQTTWKREKVFWIRVTSDGNRHDFCPVAIHLDYLFYHRSAQKKGCSMRNSCKPRRRLPETIHMEPRLSFVRSVSVYADGEILRYVRCTGRVYLTLLKRERCLWRKDMFTYQLRNNRVLSFRSLKLALRRL
jgi:hypothetical protein